MGELSEYNYPMSIVNDFNLNRIAGTITNLVFGMFFAFIALAGAFMYLTYLSDGIKNHSKYETMDIKYKGYLHSYSGMDFTIPNKSLGVPRHCAAVMKSDYNSGIARDVTPDSMRYNGPFCDNMFKQMHTWEKNAKRPSNAEKWLGSNLLFTILIGTLMIFTFHHIFTLPGNLAAYATGLRIVGWLVNLLVLIPFLIGLFLFFVAGWSDAPTSWTTKEGHTVHIQAVFVDNEGRLFKAPNNIFEWSDTSMLTELRSYGDKW